MAKSQVRFCRRIRTFSINKEVLNVLIIILSQPCCMILFSAISAKVKISSCVRYNEKRAGKFSKRAQLWFFPSKFSKLRAFGMLHPPKQHVVLKVFPENKLFHFSKRALRAISKPITARFCFSITPENIRKLKRFSDVFRGYRKATPSWNGLKKHCMKKLNKEKKDLRKGKKLRDWGLKLWSLTFQISS